MGPRWSVQEGKVTRLGTWPAAVGSAPAGTDVDGRKQKGSWSAAKELPVYNFRCQSRPHRQSSAARLRGEKELERSLPRSSHDRSDWEFLSRGTLPQPQPTPLARSQTSGHERCKLDTSPSTPHHDGPARLSELSHWPNSGLGSGLPVPVSQERPQVEKPVVPVLQKMVCISGVDQHQSSWIMDGQSCLCFGLMVKLPSKKGSKTTGIFMCICIYIHTRKYVIVYV